MFTIFCNYMNVNISIIYVFKLLISRICNINPCFEAKSAFSDILQWSQKGGSKKRPKLDLLLNHVSVRTLRNKIYYYVFFKLWLIFFRFYLTFFKDHRKKTVNLTLKSNLSLYKCNLSMLCH